MTQLEREQLARATIAAWIKERQQKGLPIFVNTAENWQVISDFIDANYRGQWGHTGVLESAVQYLTKNGQLTYPAPLPVIQEAQRIVAENAANQAEQDRMAKEAQERAEFERLRQERINRQDAMRPDLPPSHHDREALKADAERRAQQRRSAAELQERYAMMRDELRKINLHVEITGGPNGRINHARTQEVRKGARQKLAELMPEFREEILADGKRS